MNQALTDLMKPLTVPASWIYRGAIAKRNRNFDQGKRVRCVEPSTPVISVGNITVGGVGKTPFVTWLAELLLANGHRPVIAMRGYMAKPGELSDEQAEYMDRLQGVDVLANPERIAALNTYLPDHADVDCVLLDDGFQHRFVHRDLDLVLIDATRNTMRDVLLPVGRLREPLEVLRRADAVLMTHASGVDELLQAKVEHYHGKPPLAWSDHHWSHLSVYEDGPEERQVELNWLKGKPVVTLLGVGNPLPVHAQLEASGASILADIPAGDHERFDQSKLRVVQGLCEGAQALVLTAKDWVKARKLIDFSTWPVPIVVPHLVLDVFEGARELQELVLKTVEEKDSGVRS